MMPFDLGTFGSSFLEIFLEYKLWVGVGLAICLCLMLIRRFRLKRLPIRTSTNELGELYVSRGAILHLIRNIEDEMPKVHVCRIKVKDKRHTLRVCLNVKIREDQSFDEVCIQFQERIQQIIIRYLGLTKTVRVDVVLDDIEKLPKADNVPEKERT